VSLLSGYQANRAITAILSEDAATSSEGKRAIIKLKQIGEPAIPKLIEALAVADNGATIEQLLLSFVRNSTLPHFIKALDHPQQRVVDAVTRILSKSNEYDPNLLLEYFTDQDVPKMPLGAVLQQHIARINSNTLLSLLDKVSSKARPILYRLLDEVATEALIPDLAQRLDSKQPLIRMQLLKLMARFDTAQSREALTKALKDPNKAVRQAALQGLAYVKSSVAVPAITELLRDPDLTVQSTAIETLAKIRSPDTIKHLIPVLQDEAEYVRRAAVEVLNEVGDQSAVKDLLNALRDVDWWVKVRAADALGAIGGPKVFDAVLALIKDPDEFLRRTAVEILNTSKDARAFDRLIEALKDEDWWVRERAVDALASIGDQRAVPYLITMLEENPEAGQVVIRALATLGDKKAIQPLLDQLENSDNALRKEALSALETLTDDAHAAQVQAAASQLMTINTDDVGTVASQTMKTLVSRYGDRATQQLDARTESMPKAAFPALGDAPTEALAAADETQAMPRNDSPPMSASATTINAAKLTPNTMIADRYRVIRKIGEGAFGVVWLVEDTMVHDEFILKFLNPHVASDQHMIKRFMQELRYARKVTHENIIRIYDLVTFDHSYAISMEYFPSHSLASELRKRVPIPFSRGKVILSHICQGMSQAQAAGVVHRDLKPANILIDEHDMVKIVDFGLAAAASKTDSRITKSGILVGTPTYMAPEQVRGKTIDSRTDIYTIGIIMYEMFTARAPYKGEDSMAILFQHVEGKATPPREIVPTLPEALERVIMTAMAVSPQDRFQSFSELQQALDAIPTA
jgi:serine/threonine-protein kinase